MSLCKHSVVIGGHATSFTLENPFWQELGAIAKARGLSVAALVAEVDGTRGKMNLSGALRVFVLETLQARVSQQR